MTINGSTNAQGWTFKLEAYETSYSVSNNNSTVRVDMYLGRSNSQSYLGGDWNGSITVDGQTQYLSGSIAYPTYINAGGWLYLGTKDYTVGHNTDGSKVAGISASFSSGDFSPSSAWASGNLTLTTIPRASSVTATNADIGSATSININRASSSFKHTLRYLFDNLSGTIATNVDTSYGWTIPDTFYTQIPNQPWQTCYIYCDTYSGSTLIGTTVTSIRVTANEDICKPTLTGSVIDTNPDTIALTGDNTKLVKYFSTSSITYSATAKNSASISSIKINNVIVSQSPYTINNINTNQITILATDTRGYSTTLTLTPTMIDYIPLSANVSFFRTAPTTGQVSLNFEGNYYNDTFGNETNTLTIKWYYKEKNAQTWETGGTLVQNTDYVINNNTFHSGTGNYTSNIIIGSNFDYQKAYDFKFEAEDKLILYPVEQTVSKGIPIVNWDDDHFNINGDITQYEQPFAGGGGGETLPVGTIIEYPASSNLPTGWMICDGSALSRTEYSQLFNVIGTSFGSGDGSTTFNIPNKKGRVSVGVDTSQTEFNTIGKTGGEKAHTLTQRELPNGTALTSNINPGQWSLGVWDNHGQSGSTYSAQLQGQNGLPGGNQAHNILQPYIVTNFIIKVSQTTGTNGQIVDSLDGNSTTDAPSQRAVKQLTTYSTNEMKVGTWIDGKPIYRKTIYYSSLPNNEQKSYNHNIPNIENIVHIGGFAGSGTTFVPLPYVAITQQLSIGVYATTTYVAFLVNADRRSWYAYVVLEYTKTTD